MEAEKFELRSEEEEKESLFLHSLIHLKLGGGGVIRVLSINFQFNIIKKQFMQNYHFTIAI